MKFYSYCASLSLTIFVLSASNTALSQETPPPLMPPPFQSFNDLDIDLSGGISIDEVNNYHIRIFALLDGNRDGSLTRVEVVGKRFGPESFGFFASELHDFKEERFTAWELNGDGKLSKAEFLVGTLSHFARADKDGNSQLDEKEFGWKI